jgi:phenylpyruvate tautomerase PptA (4-oxalocrotonate tautomerase family)
VFVPPLPENVAELRTRIIAEVAEVTSEILGSVWQEIDYRWDV